MHALVGAAALGASKEAMVSYSLLKTKTKPNQTKYLSF